MAYANLHASARTQEFSLNILTVNLLFSTVVFWIAARIYVIPRLHELRPRSVLIPILLLHALRHLGLMFLAPGAVYGGIPPQFAYPAAFGDLTAALLAVAAIPAVAANARGARLVVWIFNIEGAVDLIAAIVLAMLYDVASRMGPAYWIPAFWVPALLVTHYITFIVLLRYWKDPPHPAFEAHARKRAPLNLSVEPVEKGNVKNLPEKRPPYLTYKPRSRVERPFRYPQFDRFFSC
jgi:hypothetical protein